MARSNLFTGPLPGSDYQAHQNYRGKSFTEEVLPVDSLEEYFENFPVLEIDFTFYRPLLDPNGQPNQNYHPPAEVAQVPVYSYLSYAKGLGDNILGINAHCRCGSLFQV